MTELSQNSKSNIADLNVVVDNKNYTGVTITDLAGNQQLFIIANDNASKTAKHSLKVNGKKYSWTGPYFYQ
ncbi:hypothetical protein GCM10027170_09090 [Aliiglaciecola aliphaticivorans]